MNTGGRPRKTLAWVDQCDRVFPEDLMAAFGVQREALRRWIRDGKLPAPDVHLTQRSVWWKRSTLAKAGIELPPNPSTPA